MLLAGPGRKPGSVLRVAAKGGHSSVRPLPGGSSDRLEIGSARATPAGLPPRSRTGLAPGGVCRAPLVTERAVRSYRTVSPLPPAEADGGLFSVALSFESPRLAVSQHPALWSPDFPRRKPFGPAATHPTNSSEKRGQYNRRPGESNPPGRPRNVTPSHFRDSRQPPAKSHAGPLPGLSPTAARGSPPDALARVSRSRRPWLPWSLSSFARPWRSGGPSSDLPNR